MKNANINKLRLKSARNIILCMLSAGFLLSAILYYFPGAIVANLFAAPPELRQADLGSLAMEDSDGWEFEMPTDHGHAHGDAEGKTAQVTVWGNRFEIFLEHPYVVAGKPTSFVTHVTDMEDHAPRREGEIEYILIDATESPIRNIDKSPARDGIYISDLTFPKAGTWSVSIAIPINGKISTVQLPPLVVFPTEKDAGDAPDQEEIEGVSFLKEQQWKFPFKTEVLAEQGGVLQIPEQSVVYGREGPIAFVHVAGETVQARNLEVGELKDRKMEVHSGLKQGDRVVIRGADAIAISTASDTDHHAGHGDHDGHEAHEPHGESEGSVHVEPEIGEALGIETAVVRNGDLSVTLDLNGWVRPLPQNVSDVHSPVEGFVADIHAWPGDFVQSSSPLVTLTVPSALEWQREVLTALNEKSSLEESNRLLLQEGRAELIDLLGTIQVAVTKVHHFEEELTILRNAGPGTVPRQDIHHKEGEFNSSLAELKAKRQLALACGVPETELAEFEKGANYQVPTLEALPPNIRRQIHSNESNLLESAIRLKVAKAKLDSIGMHHENIERLLAGDSGGLTDQLTLRALGTGVVVDSFVALQKTVSPEDHLFHLIDYRQVQIEAEVPELDLPKVISRTAGPIAISVPGLDNRTLVAAVNYLNTEMDPNERTAHLVLTADNVRGMILRDGISVTVGVPIETRMNVVRVPRGAILTDDFQEVVFVKEGNHFARTPISVGLAGLDTVEVTDGLEPGSTVAVKGALPLLLSLKKGGSAGMDHGHAHGPGQGHGQEDSRGQKKSICCEFCVE